MTRVLITGGAGFIGSHIADECLKLGFDVTTADDLSGGFLANIPPGVTSMICDLRDEAQVAYLWSRGDYDYVYHFAAYAAEGLSHFVRRYNYQTNLMASINLINESIKHDVKRFVFASSIAVYGHSWTAKRLLESAPIIKPDPYGISKRTVELDLAAAYDMFGLSSASFRLHNVFGPRQNINDKYRNVIGIFMRQLLTNEPLTIFGNGRQVREFTYIDDIAATISKSPLSLDSSHSSPVFNLGSDEHHSVLHLANEAAVAMGCNQPQIMYLPPRQETQYAVADHSAAQCVFGSQPSTTLTDGLKKMADWVKQQKPGRPTVSPEIEIDKHLPESWRT